MFGGALCDVVTSVRKLESVQEAGTEEVRASCSEIENKQNDPPERRKGRGARWNRIKIGSLISLPHGGLWLTQPWCPRCPAIYISCHIRSYANMRQPLCRGIPSYFSAGPVYVTGYSYTPSDLQGNLSKKLARIGLAWARKSFGVKPRMKPGFKATGNNYPFLPSSSMKVLF